MRQWTLYILKLQQGKYYVGITSQTPEERFQEHLHGRKSYWTEAYPPLEILQTVSLGELDFESAKQYENRVVRKVIKEKGINNVRGGDILYKDPLVIRLGYIWDKLGWESALFIIAQALFIAYLLIDKYYVR